MKYLHPFIVIQKLLSPHKLLHHKSVLDGTVSFSLTSHCYNSALLVKELLTHLICVLTTNNMHLSDFNTADSLLSSHISTCLLRELCLIQYDLVPRPPRSVRGSDTKKKVMALGSDTKKKVMALGWDKILKVMSRGWGHIFKVMCPGVCH